MPAPLDEKKIRLFTNFTLSELDKHHIEAGLRGSCPGGKILYNQSGSCDLAVVINYSRKFHWVYSSTKPLKWLMEPTVYKLSHLFTSRHSRAFGATYTHNARSERVQEIFVPPMVPPHVWPQDPKSLMDKKSKLISVIGSKESFLPLHRQRTDFLDFLEEELFSQIDVYGKGRTYVNNKSQALDEYRYSIAIENSQTPGYWTEKISDCFISLTVPIYVGAPDIETFFPPQSMITASLEDLRSNPRALFSKLSVQDYEERLPYLLEARNSALGEFSFGYQLGKLLVEKTSDRTSRAKRLFRIWTIDTFIGQMYGVLGKLYNCVVRARRAREKTG